MSQKRPNKSRPAVDFDTEAMIALIQYLQPERELIPLGCKRDPEIIAIASRYYDRLSDCKIYDMPPHNLKQLSTYVLN